MQNKLSAFGMGIQTLSISQATQIDLGPLAGLVGEWASPQDKPFGWNVIAVPGPKDTQGFTLEVIPYTETLTFTPIVVAGNRGPIIDGVQQEQNIVGLMYNQTIHSLCETDLCKKMGFEKGREIHAETGMFLYMTNLSSKFSIARLSSIPHGNSLLALGNSQQLSQPGNNFFGPAPIAPRAVPGTFPLPNGYGEFQYQQSPQFPGIFDQSNPNTFLRETLGNANIVNMTTLLLSTDNKDGGILNVPFITNHVNATKLKSTFWIQQIDDGKGGTVQQLQYSQTIDLVFPATGHPQPIIWPHVTINTLLKK